MFQQICSFIHKENVSIKINENMFYFDYAYLIRPCDITKPTIWPLPLQAICKYSNAHKFHIFSTDLDETGIKIHGLLRSFILNIIIINVAVPFKLL